MTLLRIKHLGLTDYSATWRAMQAFTLHRDADTPDEIWVTEHPPVYTQGLNRKDAKPPARQDIPVVETDRGGKITYHGPGQLVIYLLFDMKRSGLSVRQLVSHLENAVIKLLQEYGISAKADPKAPGVYVSGKKIASLGLRLRNGCCYHGLSLNVDMDLAPFSAIDPCGYQGMEVTQTRDFGIHDSMTDLAEKLLNDLVVKVSVHP